MKVDIQKVNSYEEEQAVIRAVQVTENIQTAIHALENSSLAITARSNGKTLFCPIDKIYYIESVDKRSFVYTRDDCLEVQYRLYELENTLSRNFFRAAKAMIINMRKIKSVRAELNGRMTAELLNGERVIITRSYVKELKERLGL